jgi:hypothetical protein
MRASDASDLSDAVMALPSLERLEHPAAVAHGFWLPTGGVSAFGGALRLFTSRPVSVLPALDAWNAPDGWIAAYGPLAPPWRSVGEDAFGAQLLLSPDGTEVARFEAETGELERLGVTPADFLSLVVADPADTISLPLYEACVKRFGRIALGQHCAFKVEIAAGGSLDADNVLPMDAWIHMKGLGKVALRRR